MARRKTNYTLSPWLSARTDNREKRFIQLGDTMFFSPAFQELSAGARLLYLSFSMEAAGKWEFVFPLSTALKHGFSQASFRRYVTELVDKGFVTMSSGANTREKNIYRFSLRWKTERPP